MNCKWADEAAADADGNRVTYCLRCGRRTKPHKHPHNKIRATCRIPGIVDWLDHLALVYLGIGRERFAYVTLGFRFAVAMFWSYLGWFRVPGKPGSTLAKMIHGVTGISFAATGCDTCRKHIEHMDADPEWTAANVLECVGYLRDAAEKRNLPFHEWGAGVLVKRAITISGGGK
jgi:hypothetical protein